MISAVVVEFLGLLDDPVEGGEHADRGHIHEVEHDPEGSIKVAQAEDPGALDDKEQPCDDAAAHGEQHYCLEEQGQALLLPEHQGGPHYQPHAAKQAAYQVGDQDLVEQGALFLYLGDEQ
jgi:hypothetical protein